MAADSTSSIRQSLGLALAACALTACGGGGGGGSSSDFAIIEVSNGFGKMLPHTIAVKGPNGLPTSQFVELTTFDQLVENVTPNNPIRVPPRWPLAAELPNGLPGNHFLYARFTQGLDPASLISRDVNDPPGTLADGIRVQIINPVTGQATPIPGRAFVGGATYGPDVDPDDSSKYALTTWVTENGGALEAATINGQTPGLGFPGTEPGTSFAGDLDLLFPSTFVFVADGDEDLESLESFPVGSLQVCIGTDVVTSSGRNLRADRVGLAASSVGPDNTAPEVKILFPTGDPDILPRKASADVDPQANVFVQFTEPIQVLSIGSLDDGTPPALSPAIQLVFGPSSSRVSVPFSVRPISMFDFSRFELVPLYDFPGTGPQLPGGACDSSFGTVDVTVAAGQIRDLPGLPNAQSPASFFMTREGPGLVNAPVTPDAVYIGRTGSVQGISVIDLNGFGGGTGNPAWTQTNPIVKGNSNFPNNPNVALQGSLLIPPLTNGECTFNGGSSGPFTLVRDSSLRDVVASAPLIESVGDMALGHALDNTFNNESPFGCQSGGGNICAQTGLKNIALIAGGPNTVASANISNQVALKQDPGVENLASWAPHPNPPPLVFPPLCLSPLINALEPTAIDSTYLPAPSTANNQYGPQFPVRSGLGLRNLLVPGPFPLGIPSIGLPPQGTLTSEQNSFFEGPATPQPTIQSCSPFMMRQQVGQFLYVVDRVASEIVVFNSNRFTVLDRIRLLDPTSLAMSPNLDFLAVTNEGADLVAFIDVNPASPNFHEVIKTTPVGSGPTGIAWESANEDIFVCNQGDGSVSVISAFTLDVRKTLRNQLSRPIDVALTPRQQTFGFLRGVYFGYILNQNGSVAIFESGPDGLNGIGFDDVIASLPFTFARPKTIQIDGTNLNSAVWIVHESPLDENGLPTGRTGGAVSNVGISGGTIGAIPLDPGPFANPSLRDLTFSVLASFGEDNGLSGIPVDIAFDNMRNLSALTNFQTTFSPGNPLSYNGKSQVKLLGGGALRTNSPQFMFLAVPNPGVVDVFDVTGGSNARVDTDPFIPGFQSIAAPNASVLMDYFRM